MTEDSPTDIEDDLEDLPGYESNASESEVAGDVANATGATDVITPAPAPRRGRAERAQNRAIRTPLEPETIVLSDTEEN